MITVEIRIGATTAELTVTGHAGAGSKGKDIVCAAASMLAQTAAQEAAHYAKIYPKAAFRIAHMDMDDGRLRLVTEAEREIQEQWKTALHLVATGFEMLAETYPKSVKFLMGGGVANQRVE